MKFKVIGLGGAGARMTHDFHIAATLGDTPLEIQHRPIRKDRFSLLNRMTTPMRSRWHYLLSLFGGVVIPEIPDLAVADADMNNPVFHRLLEYKPKDGAKKRTSYFPGRITKVHEAWLREGGCSNHPIAGEVLMEHTLANGNKTRETLLDTVGRSGGEDGMAVLFSAGGGFGSGAANALAAGFKDIREDPQRTKECFLMGVSVLPGTDVSTSTDLLRVSAGRMVIQNMSHSVFDGLCLVSNSILREVKGSGELDVQRSKTMVNFYISKMLMELSAAYSPNLVSHETLTPADLIRMSRNRSFMFGYSEGQIRSTPRYRLRDLTRRFIEAVTPVSENFDTDDILLKGLSLPLSSNSYTRDLDDLPDREDFRDVTIDNLPQEFLHTARVLILYGIPHTGRTYLDEKSRLGDLAEMFFPDAEVHIHRYHHAKEEHSITVWIYEPVSPMLLTLTTDYLNANWEWNEARFRGKRKRWDTHKVFVDDIAYGRSPKDDIKETIKSREEVFSEDVWPNHSSLMRLLGEHYGSGDDDIERRLVTREQIEAGLERFKDGLKTKKDRSFSIVFE